MSVGNLGIPRDFDIFRPFSSQIIPCSKTSSKGNFPKQMFVVFVKKWLTQLFQSTRKNNLFFAIENRTMFYKKEKPEKYKKLRKCKKEILRNWRTDAVDKQYLILKYVNNYQYIMIRRVGGYPLEQCWAWPCEPPRKIECRGPSPWGPGGSTWPGPPSAQANQTLWMGTNILKQDIGL